jgi:hypothetical protein
MELSEMCPITAEITTVSPARVIHNLKQRLIRKNIFWSNAEDMSMSIWWLRSTVKERKAQQRRMKWLGMMQQAGMGESNVIYLALRKRLVALIIRRT